MRLVIVAVGQRQPAWAREAFDEFAKRMPAETRLELIEVKAEPRDGGKRPAQLMAAEGARLLAAAPKRAHRVALDERGTRRTTAELAARLRAWRATGCDVVFWIGGPDGLEATLRTGADETLSLS